MARGLFVLKQTKVKATAGLFIIYFYTGLNGIEYPGCFVYWYTMCMWWWGEWYRRDPALGKGWTWRETHGVNAHVKWDEWVTSASDGGI